ncbi:MAG: DUF1284 domain-containing protein [Candidatus Ratteibacteria bacterium]
MINLRPHHLFCILGFCGRGYNKTFAENMEQICYQIKNNPGIKIVLVDGVDDICNCCPYNSGSVCLKKTDSEASLKNREKEIIRILGLDFNVSIEAVKIYNQIKNLYPMDAIIPLCEQCEWYCLGYCKKGFENLKKGGFFNEKV